MSATDHALIYISLHWSYVNAKLTVEEHRAICYVKLGFAGRDGGLGVMGCKGMTDEDFHSRRVSPDAFDGRYI